MSLPVQSGAVRTASSPVRGPASPSGGGSRTSTAVVLPTISLPKGGGAIRGMGEKFAANPVTGTGSMTVPLPTSPGRSGFGPQLSLTYDSGSGNGPFGLGWGLPLPAITRKTERGLPQYDDARESDVFILSGAEDLAPVFRQDWDGDWVASHPGHQRDAVGFWVRDSAGHLIVHEDELDGYRVRRYRPRLERLFARIERWSRIGTASDVHWRSLSKDNVLTVYGLDANARIADPLHPDRIFSWLICETRDDRGNAMLYRYREEDGQGVPLGQAHQRNRGSGADPRRTANRYLKRIQYGNRTPLLDAAGRRPRFLSQPQIENAGWMFEWVLDYGEHEASTPGPRDAAPWSYRADPFSSYRAGFEIRTTRLCRRTLMFHHFPDEAGVDRDCLVSSTDFGYSDEVDPDGVRHPVYAFLRSITQTGYRRNSDGYARRSLPPVEFEYTQPVVQGTVEEIDAKDLENLPIGLDGSAYRWTDLHGEGIPGLLTEQAGAWFYKRNLSPIPTRLPDGDEVVEARFAPLECVRHRPAAALGHGAEFLDLAGDGQPDIVVMDQPTPGWYEHDAAESWQPFRPFATRLTLDLHAPNLRFLDLDGDGHPDLLMTEDDAFVWHQSLGEAGFGPAQRVAGVFDEEKGPRVVFADVTQSIYLADMSGDGLTDIVRIRNGEICYWPNLGHGRFGAKVTMNNAPRLDHTDRFEQRRLRLADVDGSGTTDLIYLHPEGVRLYFNQSGNGWSRPRQLDAFPRIDDLASVVPIDLLGNGTACLVWSSPLPGDARCPLRYVRLMGAQKPHLLVRTVNHLGAEARITYAPSTKFYVLDRRDGNPWATRLPFPVHVVERVETHDHVSRNRFTTRYAYHHGYFDGEEREFRGFGMVEQWDTEGFSSFDPGGAEDRGEEATNWDAGSHVPPVLTKTWFHTGAYLETERISAQFEGEYYREGDPGSGAGGLTDDQFEATLLPDTVLPDGLTAPESREACRALKGAVLRQETYALDRLPDGTPTEAADRPYAVSERNYTIRRLQPRGGNRHAVWFTHPRETIDFHYERRLYEVQGEWRADPRVAHAFTLEVDDSGNVRQAVSVGYGRRYDDPDLSPEDRVRQRQTLLILTENAYTNAVVEGDAYRTPLPCETRAFELVNVRPDAPQPHLTSLFRFEDLRTQVAAASDGAHDLPYEDLTHASAAQDHPYRRLIEHARTYYRPDDLGASRQNDPAALLPLGRLEALALTGESLELAFTPGLVGRIFIESNKLAAGELENVLGAQGGYRHSENDLNWWIPSGRGFLSPGSNDGSAAELGFAIAHFFLPHRVRDPFGNEATLAYDNYALLVVRTTDALQNQVSASHDYRVLQPRRITDPNDNRAEAAFDALGLVVATAVLGKAPEPDGNPKGDRLQGFAADLDVGADIQPFVANPLGRAPELLGDATTRIVYDLDRFQRCGQPPFAAALARETHVQDLPAGTTTRIQVSFVYSDGFGREIQTKVRAEPGEARWRDPVHVPVRRGEPPAETGDIEPGPLVPSDGEPPLRRADPRWVGAGRTVYNNKGKPVKTYEPFFSSTHLYEPEPEVTDTGVTPVLFYDPLERVIATLRPNHTYEKVVFDPWRQASSDVNDTVTADPRTDPDVLGHTDKYFAAQPAGWRTWQAQRIGGGAGTHEQEAAAKAAVHADTPATVYFDTLGRPFLTAVHNRWQRGDETDEAQYTTRVELDIEGNQRAVIDARGRTVMTRDYDLLGNRIRQVSMDAGTRWMLNDVTGKPLRSWDDRNHEFRTAYDALRRPTHLYVRPGNGPEVLVERTVYGEALGEAAAATNHRGRVYQHYDQAGVATSEAYDFKGNLWRSHRRLALEYRRTIDWLPLRGLADPADLAAAAETLLEVETFASSTIYDALNRPIQAIAPHSINSGHLDVIRPGYNDAGLLERIDAWLQREGEPDGLLEPSSADHHFVPNIDYNAKGQRTSIAYGNGAETRYRYDPETFRLVHLQTSRGEAFPDDCPDSPAEGWPGCAVQNLRYTYDPAGNITHIRDDAQQTVFFRNRRVEPSADYTYDSIYRLIEAQGREHLGQTNGQLNSPRQVTHDDSFRQNLPHPGDGNAMGSYLEQYDYDEVGNVLRMIHTAATGGWTRRYVHADDSNRLLATSLPGDDPAGPYSARYEYDAHGSMTRMPQLPLMRWDYHDQLQATSHQVVNNGGTPETTYYAYDGAGQRVRKVTERAAQNGELPRRKDERLYLDGFEVYREYSSDGDTATLERETLHILDDQQRIALVETRTQGSDGSPQQLIRYQFGNHLGSASLELDDQAQILSYEEYTPYGSTSYQAVRSDVEVSSKRYRYTGMERDEENALAYHGARYYAPWLGRWLSCDSSGQQSGEPNLHLYVRDRPINRFDPDGNDPVLPVALAAGAVGAVISELSEIHRQVTVEDRRFFQLDDRRILAAGAEAFVGTAGSVLASRLGPAGIVAGTAISTAAGGAARRAVMGESTTAAGVVNEFAWGATMAMASSVVTRLAGALTGTRSGPSAAAEANTTRLGRDPGRTAPQPSELKAPPPDRVRINLLPEAQLQSAATRLHGPRGRYGTTGITEGLLPSGHRVRTVASEGGRLLPRSQRAMLGSNEVPVRGRPGVGGQPGEHAERATTRIMVEEHGVVPERTAASTRHCSSCAAYHDAAGIMTAGSRQSSRTRIHSPEEFRLWFEVTRAAYDEGIRLRAIIERLKQR